MQLNFDLIPLLPSAKANKRRARKTLPAGNVRDWAHLVSSSASEDTMSVVNAWRDSSRRRMLWSDSADRTLKDSERQLLDVIASGELDAHLVAIADAVHARLSLLHSVR